MFAAFFKPKCNNIGFEDVQFAIQNPEQFLVINTLMANEQDCLISTTVSDKEEETILNQLIADYDVATKRVVVYGKHSADYSSLDKYNQLYSLGFQNVFLYRGGMLEWMLLQDVYGADEFPTTKKTLDILKFKPLRQFGGLYIT